MAKYVTLYNFTEQGIRSVKESPGRLAAGIKKAQGMGIKVLSAHYTEGPYDLVVISETADEKASVAFALAIGMQGNVRSTTMRAWDAQEFEQITKMI